MSWWVSGLEPACGPALAPQCVATRRKDSRLGGRTCIIHEGCAIAYYLRGHVAIIVLDALGSGKGPWVSLHL